MSDKKNKGGRPRRVFTAKEVNDNSILAGTVSTKKITKPSLTADSVSTKKITKPSPHCRFFFRDGLGEVQSPQVQSPNPRGAEDKGGGNRFKVDDVVSVKRSDGNWYLGTVMCVNLNGTYDIVFLNGDSRTNVPEESIKENQENQDLLQKFNSQASI